MEDILLRALDLGGTLTLAVAILIVGCKKLDSLDDKLEKLLRITAIGFNTPEKREKISEVLGGK